MKLIIKEYLSSLRERGELDAILPDLLSQMGLNVYSTPGRGTRQDGVDVGAVGSIDGEKEKVYLFSVKPGDLTRKGWDSSSVNALRQSMNQIQDAYIPNRLPPEHREKDIVICIAIGGNVDEQLRPDLAGYMEQNKKKNITFEEWNGDKIASLIQSHFLREDLLPEDARPRLRKSLAMLDEPDVSYRYFAELIQSLSEIETRSVLQSITAIRQMSICLWILFAWARGQGNTESVFRSGELAILHAWNIAKIYAGKKSKTAKAILSAYFSIFSAYHQICNQYLGKNVIPYVEIPHGISSAICSMSSLDINLKLFDLLGRLATDGIWSYWNALRQGEDDTEARNASLDEMNKCSFSIRALISNNPALCLPIKDDQAIDICIATFLLALDSNNHDFIKSWHLEIITRARFYYEVNGEYPCVLRKYTELLEHPKSHDSKYREEATNASILYPTIALWAALLGDEVTYNKISLFKRELLEHCTFQFWIPYGDSELHFYNNSDIHGAAITEFTLDQSMEDFIEQVVSECEQTSYFKELSAVEFGWDPLIFVACRHYRLPLPLHMLVGLRKNTVR